MIQSEVFIFNIGKDSRRRSFSVHSKVVAATSSYFRALVNNGMVESCTKTVEYPDVEPEDFARFIEYAYRKDYCVPTWVHEKTDEKDKALPSPPRSWFGQHSSIPLSGQPARQARIGLPSPTPLFGQPAPQAGFGQPSSKTLFDQSLPEKKKKPTFEGGDAVRAHFDTRSYLAAEDPRTVMLVTFEPKHNIAPNQDFTPVFLGHARLYTFACMRGVDPLRRLTLHKLHRTLLGFQLYSRRVWDIVELARYAYNQGEDRKVDGTKDELRQLVLEYIVREVTVFGKHPAFLLLLEEGGEFVVDFWSLVSKEKI
ncbi:hypothetical protein COCCADRAFT_99288 [Bipolaris zeicola 26-R-13]|uniref:BTB domain-containing protein n=1 Tax=Cochliobolus carbonum (strain 26-R-13) TaxID=930089 RepID=W6Y9W2_COCC2|nr:uncharacterized protein COCCADRAFT_99288 [Bipolaris zeicola 26-R-13]EUC32209.1 hypothetical protein COCCADRAFT_99288 [Bipolaris zeicola 26-R-13]